MSSLRKNLKMSCTFIDIYISSKIKQITAENSNFDYVLDPIQFYFSFLVLYFQSALHICVLPIFTYGFDQKKENIRNISYTHSHTTRANAIPAGIGSKSLFCLSVYLFVVHCLLHTQHTHTHNQSTASSVLTV